MAISHGTKLVDFLLTGYHGEQTNEVVMIHVYEMYHEISKLLTRLLEGALVVF